MDGEIKITIIVSIIIFASIGFFAMETMNSVPLTKLPSKDIVEKIPTREYITDESAKNLKDIPHITLKKLDNNLVLESTTVAFNIPGDNTHPWGYISGKVVNPAPGHPVIIQLFKSLEGDPIHLGQIDLNDDNSFEYKFRVLSINGDDVIRHYKGDYFVKIFKTVKRQ